MPSVINQSVYSKRERERGKKNKIVLKNYDYAK